MMSPLHFLCPLFQQNKPVYDKRLQWRTNGACLVWGEMLLYTLMIEKKQDKTDRLIDSIIKCKRTFIFIFLNDSDSWRNLGYISKLLFHHSSILNAHSSDFKNVPLLIFLLWGLTRTWDSKLEMILRCLLQTTWIWSNMWTDKLRC